MAEWNNYNNKYNRNNIIIKHINDNDHNNDSASIFSIFVSHGSEPGPGNNNRVCEEFLLPCLHVWTYNACCTLP